jgi:hypothetical protein
VVVLVGKLIAVKFPRVGTGADFRVLQVEKMLRETAQANLSWSRGERTPTYFMDAPPRNLWHSGITWAAIIQHAGGAAAGLVLPSMVKSTTEALEHLLGDDLTPEVRAAAGHLSRWRYDYLDAPPPTKAWAESARRTYALVVALRAMRQARRAALQKEYDLILRLQRFEGAARAGARAAALWDEGLSAPDWPHPTVPTDGALTPNQTWHRFASKAGLLLATDVDNSQDALVQLFGPAASKDMLLAAKKIDRWTLDGEDNWAENSLNGIELAESARVEWKTLEAQLKERQKAS